MLQNASNNASINSNVIDGDMFSDKSSASKSDELNPLKLLGALLGELRKTKEMSLLMVCRSISKLEIVGKQVVIFGEDNDVLELQTNERFRSVISKFFADRGLTFSVNEQKENTEDLDKLKFLLGSKLVIKNQK